MVRTTRTEAKQKPKEAIPTDKNAPDLAKQWKRFDAGVRKVVEARLTPEELEREWELWGGASTKGPPREK